MKSLMEILTKEAESEFRCNRCKREFSHPFQKHFANGHICEGQIIKYQWVSVDVLKQWQQEAIKVYNDFPSRCEFATDDDYSVARYEWEKKMEKLLGLEASAK